jgi:hypothetical protein
MRLTQYSACVSAIVIVAASTNTFAESAKDALAKCLATPQVYMQVTYLNRFPVNAYDDMLRRATSTCPDPDWGEWQECMGSNAVLWPDDELQAALDDYRIRLYKGPRLKRWTKKFTAPTYDYALDFKGTREFCIEKDLTYDASATQKFCISRLQQHIEALRQLSNSVLQLLDYEQAVSNEAVDIAHEDSCHARFARAVESESGAAGDSTRTGASDSSAGAQPESDAGGGGRTGSAGGAQGGASGGAGASTGGSSSTTSATKHSSGGQTASGGGIRPAGPAAAIPSSTPSMPVSLPGSTAAILTGAAASTAALGLLGSQMSRVEDGPARIRFEILTGFAGAGTGDGDTLYVGWPVSMRLATYWGFSEGRYTLGGRGIEVGAYGSVVPTNGGKVFAGGGAGVRVWLGTLAIGAIGAVPGEAKVLPGGELVLGMTPNNRVATIKLIAAVAKSDNDLYLRFAFSGAFNRLSWDIGYEQYGIGGFFALQMGLHLPK